MPVIKLLLSIGLTAIYWPFTTLISKIYPHYHKLTGFGKWVYNLDLKVLGRLERTLEVRIDKFDTWLIKHGYSPKE